MLKEISKEENDTDSCEEMLTLAEKYEHRAVGESRLVLLSYCYHIVQPGFIQFLTVLLGTAIHTQLFQLQAKKL